MGWSEVKWLWDKSWFIRGPVAALALVTIILPLLGIERSELLRFSHGITERWSDITGWLFTWTKLFGVELPERLRSTLLLLLFYGPSVWRLSRLDLSPLRNSAFLHFLYRRPTMSKAIAIVAILIAWLFTPNFTEDLVAFWAALIGSVFSLYVLLLVSDPLAKGIAASLAFLATLQLLYFAPVINTHMCEAANILLEEAKNCSA